MKIVEDRPDRLQLRVLPFGAAALLGGITLLLLLWAGAMANAGQMMGGLIIAAIGVSFFVGCFGVFVKVLTVTLDRKQTEAEVVESGIFGKKHKTFPLAEVHGATLQSMVIKRKPGDLAKKGRIRHDMTSEPRVWRVALARTNNTPLPLTDVYGNENTARAIGGAINAWYGKPD
jgi:hypothetical protein